MQEILIGFTQTMQTAQPQARVARARPFHEEDCLVSLKDRLNPAPVKEEAVCAASAIYAQSGVIFTPLVDQLPQRVRIRTPDAVTQ
jgi:hypothetical protein